MLEITQTMQGSLTAEAVLSRVHKAFVRSLPEFGTQPLDVQAEFVIACRASANENGLQSEMGIAAFGLAGWWLGPGFARSSVNLVQALGSDLPEIRKVHMLNEWSRARIANPSDSTAAERALQCARAETAAWGEK